MFKLSDNFISNYRGKQPNWGYGDLSYFVYKRTYARMKDDGSSEEFWETCQRVVEGVFNIQLNHCKKMGLEWNGNKAQSSAQKMFERMWQMKFLPPGRGLWLMGTEIVDKIGSGGLNNPLHEDTQILTKEHGWVALKDIEGQSVTVLSNTKLYGRDNSTSANPVWAEATISEGEMHPCLEIEYKDREGNTYSVISSENHRWFRKHTSKHDWERVNATELQVGDYMPKTKPMALNFNLCPIGVQHGYFFGDGTKLNGELHQFGEENIQILRDLFTNVHDAAEVNDGTSHAVVRHLPLAWGSAPGEEYQSDRRYMLGFLAGYMAADGSVSNGGIKISSSSIQNLQTVKQIAHNLGIATGEIRLVSTSSNFKEERELYEITFNRYDLNEGFFVKPSHREKYLAIRSNSTYDTLRITNIRKLDGLHRVLCATVPGYEQFVTEGFVLTSNCGFISTKDIAKDFSMPFVWATDMLMLGVGIGFDAKGAGTMTIYKPSSKEETTFVIPDTREGWVQAVGTLLQSYVKAGNPRVVFDYTKIRPAGSPIKGFGGVSCGHEPLKDGLESIAKVLDALDGKPITSVAIVDIMNFIGKFVVSGNVRRSAEIAIGDEGDIEFIRMMDPELHGEELMDRRWASNNSVFMTPESDFTEVVDRIQRNGEPGLIFIDNACHYGRMKDGWHDTHSSKYDEVDGVNPCAEQTLKHGELCCLVETFPANHDSFEDYCETLKFAFLYAKTVTLVPTHNPLTNQVMLSNRRIGLSMSGIQQALKKFGFAGFFEQFCDEGYERVRHWDRTYSRWLGIPTSIKVTTVKPSGTVSLLAGATPGVHCTHSKYYFRTFRVSALSPLLAKLIAANYRIEFAATDKQLLNKAGWKKDMGDLLDKDNHQSEQFTRYAELGGSLVVYFPVQEKNFTKSKFDISVWEQLCLARELQDKWSDNSVSITVTFKESEANDLKSAIEYMAPYVKTLSFLPLVDHKYEQAPYQEITEEQYKEYSSSLKRLRLTSAKNVEAAGENYCTNDTCSL